MINGQKSLVLAWGAFFSVFLISVSCWAQEPAANPPLPLDHSASGPAERAIKPDLNAMENVTLDFKDADIRNVLKIIAIKAGVNIVATPEVIGNVSIKLVDVPWEKALDVILKTNNFGYEWTSDKVIMVATLEKLTLQRKAQVEATENEPQVTEVFVLNFSKAENIKTTLDKLISAKGKIVLENRSNAIIITDTKSNLLRIAEIIKRLDKMTAQVMIEAKIIETTLGNTEKLGIDWQTQISAAGAKRPTTFPFKKWGSDKDMYPVPEYSTDVDADTGIVTITSEFPFGQDPYLSSERPIGFGSFPMAGSTEFKFGTLDLSAFTAVLEMLSSRSDTKIISNPRITTLNNQEARILVGTKVPIPTYDYSKDTGNPIRTGYVNQEIGITLIVTPNVNEQNYITLRINPKVEEILRYLNDEVPIISSRSADTTVMIKDGRTLVIGGLISENKSKTKTGVPILGSLPILDKIFGKKTDIASKTELIIFITPHIIQEDEFSSEEMDKIEKSLRGISEKSTKKEKGSRK